MAMSGGRNQVIFYKPHLSVSEFMRFSITLHSFFIKDTNIFLSVAHVKYFSIIIGFRSANVLSAYFSRLAVDRTQKGLH